MRLGLSQNAKRPAYSVPAALHKYCSDTLNRYGFYVLVVMSSAAVLVMLVPSAAVLAAGFTLAVLVMVAFCVGVKAELILSLIHI